MKTGRRSFLKVVGAMFGGLALFGRANAVPQPQPQPQPYQRMKMVLGKGNMITFVLDIPNQEVRCKGFTRTENGDLAAFV